MSLAFRMKLVTPKKYSAAYACAEASWIGIFEYRLKAELKSDYTLSIVAIRETSATVQC